MRELTSLGQGARRRGRLPVSSSPGSGQAGGHRALRLPRSSSPARLTAAADGCFPRYYNNQQATARSEPLRRRLPPGVDNARLRARTNVVTAAQRAESRSRQKP